MDCINIVIRLPRDIELKIHWSLTLVLLFIAYMAVFVNPIYCIFAVIYTLTVMHELAHLFTARHFGLDCSRIEITPLGGTAFVSANDNPLHDLLISLAGPGTDLMMSALFYAIGRIIAVLDLYYLGFLYGIVMVLAQISFVIAVYNLWPIFPLDGGCAFRGILAFRYSYEDATLFVARFTQVISVIGAVYFLNCRDYFSAIYLLYSIVSSEEELAAVRRRKSLHFLDKYFGNDETEETEKDEKFREAMDKVDAVLDETPEDK